MPCKSESEIRSAIARVHAEFDQYSGPRLKAFEQRAAHKKGLPPLRVDTLYVITEDDQMRDGRTVLFIGLKSDCVSTVFSFPTRLYRELATLRRDVPLVESLAELEWRGPRPGLVDLCRKLGDDGLARRALQPS